MSNLVPLLYGLMKLALVVGVMVLVATAPSRASASAASRTPTDHWPMQSVFTSTGHDISSQSRGYARIDPANFETHAPFNQFGSFGVSAGADETGCWQDIESAHHTSTLITSDFFEHSITNIDGTPMCGGLDINGNVYGVTDTHFDSWTCGGTSSMFD